MLGRSRDLVRDAKHGARLLVARTVCSFKPSLVFYAKRRIPLPRRVIRSKNNTARDLRLSRSNEAAI